MALNPQSPWPAATTRAVAAGHRDGDGRLRSGGYTTLYSTAKSPPPAKRRGWEVDIDVLRLMYAHGLHRLDNSLRNCRVCDAAAAVMIKGPEVRGFAGRA